MEVAAAEAGTAAVKAGACSPLVKIVIAVVAGVVVTGTAVGVGVGLTVGNNGAVDTVSAVTSTQTPGSGATATNDVTGVTNDVTCATNDVRGTDPTGTGGAQDTTVAGGDGTTEASGTGSNTTGDSNQVTNSSRTGETTESGNGGNGSTTQAGGATQNGGTTQNGGINNSGGTTQNGGQINTGATTQASGGVSQNGGTTQNGGINNSGGTTQNGGQINTGATTQAIGGVSQNGGTTQNGGIINTGGTTQASGTSFVATTTPVVTTAAQPQTTTPGYTCTNGYSRTVVMLKFTTNDNVFFRGGGASGTVRLNHTGEPFDSPVKAAFTRYYYWTGGDNFLDWDNFGEAQRRYNGVEEAGGSPAAKTSNLAADENYYHLNTYGADYWAMDTCMHCDDTTNGFFEIKAYRVTGGWESDRAQDAECDGTAPLPDRTKPGSLNGNHVGRCGAINVFEYEQNKCTINSF